MNDDIILRHIEFGMNIKIFCCKENVKHVQVNDHRTGLFPAQFIVIRYCILYCPQGEILFKTICSHQTNNGTQKTQYLSYIQQGKILHMICKILHVPWEIKYINT